MAILFTRKVKFHINNRSDRMTNLPLIARQFSLYQILWTILLLPTDIYFSKRNNWKTEQVKYVLTLNIFYILFSSFYYWLWTGKYLLISFCQIKSNEK